MISAIQYFIRSTDAAIAGAYLSIFRERNALMPFLFHSLFRDEREIALNLVDPLQRTTVAQFRQFIEYYLRHGYRFISPADLLGGLGPDGKYAMITFDDGYYNNTLALPILEEYKVPALFFISTNHVRDNKSFWWDALYRQRAAEGLSHRQIEREALSFKTLTTDRIEAELVARFGPQVLKPRGDIDRPFTPAELRQFAQNPYVHLGNHTANHAILTNYTPDQVRRQIHNAQESLREMAGVSPITIAYPNGANTDSIVQICRDGGMKAGFTIRPGKTPLPLDGGSPRLLQLSRFIPHGDSPMLTQCRTYRCDFQLYGLFRIAYLRLFRPHAKQ